MALELRCPSCAHPNAADAAICANCNFPLREGPPAPPPTDAAAPPADVAALPAPVPVAAPAAKADEPVVDRRKMRPVRPRRPADPQQQLQTQLVIVLGGLAVVITILWVAWKGFQKNNPPPPEVAGATPQQLADINLAENQLRADSTNINAQIMLANVLYDTANWSEAIVHYRSALRLDPTRVTTVVDLGVCYFNLSDPVTAESLFTHALVLDPRQPVALFNLGIVSESHGEKQKALEYYHRALQAGPPQGMSEALDAAIKRVMAQSGTQAPAMPGGGSGQIPQGGGF